MKRIFFSLLFTASFLSLANQSFQRIRKKSVLSYPSDAHVHSAVATWFMRAAARVPTIAAAGTVKKSCRNSWPCACGGAKAGLYKRSSKTQRYL